MRRRRYQISNMRNTNVHFRTVLCVVATLAGLTVSSSAHAGAYCETDVVANHQPTSPCGSTELPDHSSGTTDMSCNGFSVHIAFDLHLEPNTITLQMTSPSGVSKSSSTSPEVHIVDSNGDGAIVRCDIDN